MVALPLTLLMVGEHLGSTGSPRAAGIQTVYGWSLGIHGVARGAHRPWRCTDGIRALVVLSDGRIAFGSANGLVRVWDPQGDHEAQVFKGHRGGVRALAVLPDGYIVSGADDGSVRVWDPQGRHAPRVFAGHTRWVRALAVLPGGRIASGASDCTVRVWDALTGKRRALFVADAGITALLGARDNMIVAGDEGGAVHFLRFIG